MYLCLYTIDSRSSCQPSYNHNIIIQKEEILFLIFGSGTLIFFSDFFKMSSIKTDILQLYVHAYFTIMAHTDTDVQPHEIQECISLVYCNCYTIIGLNKNKLIRPRTNVFLEPIDNLEDLDSDFAIIAIIWGLSNEETGPGFLF